MNISQQLTQRKIPYKKVSESYMVTLNNKTYDAILEMQNSYPSVSFIVTNMRF